MYESLITGVKHITFSLQGENGLPGFPGPKGIKVKLFYFFFFLLILK